MAVLTALLGSSVGLVAATATTADAAPNCYVLSKAIVRMLAAAELSRQAGFMDVYNYRIETVLYYESMYESQGCP